MGVILRGLRKMVPKYIYGTDFMWGMQNGSNLRGVRKIVPIYIYGSDFALGYAKWFLYSSCWRRVTLYYNEISHIYMGIIFSKCKSVPVRIALCLMTANSIC